MSNQQSLQDQMNSQKIELYSAVEEKDNIRLHLDQLNAVLDRMGLQENVYTELVRLNSS